MGLKPLVYLRGRSGGVTVVERHDEFATPPWVLFPPRPTVSSGKVPTVAPEYPRPEGQQTRANRVTSYSKETSTGPETFRRTNTSIFYPWSLRTRSPPLRGKTGRVNEGDPSRRRLPPRGRECTRETVRLETRPGYLGSVPLPREFPSFSTSLSLHQWGNVSGCTIILSSCFLFSRLHSQ